MQWCHKYNQPVIGFKACPRKIKVIIHAIIRTKTRWNIVPKTKLTAIPLLSRHGVKLISCDL